MTYRFKLVGVSGTFDKLHKGHRVLLSKALEIGEKVMVGLTSDEMCSRKSLVTSNGNIGNSMINN